MEEIVKKNKIKTHDDILSLESVSVSLSVLASRLPIQEKKEAISSRVFLVAMAVGDGASVA